ncbi:MAG: hypothetical protein JW801_13710 [Bacteroidales bacterium]|nr:hypothetical protein [Bacteroidales bacterium]
MKKLNLFLGLGAIVISLLFSACEGLTSSDAPTITLDNTDPIVLAVGVETTDIEGTIVAEAGLAEVKIYQTIDLSEQLIATINDFSTGVVTTTDSINYTLAFTLTDVTEDVTITIEAVDNEAQTATETIDVQASELDEFSLVLMGAQSNADYGSTASLTTGNVYKITGQVAANNSDDVDIVYYYGSKEAALYSPTQADIQDVTDFDIVSWTTINETMLGISTTIASGEFEGVATVAEIEAAGTPDLDVVPTLTIGDVIVFETAGGKKGIFKVSALETGASGTITISVRVQR